VDDVDPFMMRRLSKLTELGAALLKVPPDRRTPVEWKTHYRDWLDRVGIAATGSKYRSTFLAEVERHWGRCLELWGGAAELTTSETNLAWPVKMAQYSHQAFPPLLHLLLKDYLSAAYFEKRKVGVNFGDGPWPCLNPVARHRGQLCVTRTVRKPRTRGRMTAHFHCGCGHVYSRGMYDDGTLSKPKTVRWGPVAESFVISQAREGRSAGWIGTRLRVTAGTVFLIVQRMGLDAEAEFGWQPPKAARSPVGPLPPVPAARSAGRKRGRAGRKFLDWASVDVELSTRLPLVEREIKDLRPPVRITAALLAQRFGWNASWLVSCMNRLPTLAPLWTEAVETNEQWNERRRIYAVERLLTGAETMDEREKRWLVRLPGVAATLRSMKSAGPGVNGCGGI
jgi:hypothetical protein